jgi:hypothetical protein
MCQPLSEAKGIKPFRPTFAPKQELSNIGAGGLVYSLAGMSVLSRLVIQQTQWQNSTVESAQADIHQASTVEASRHALILQY